MTLSFSQKWPKSLSKHMPRPTTLFPFKVLKSLEEEYPEAMHAFKMRTFFSYDRFEGFYSGIMQSVYPKLHTIREDKGDNWKAGRDIHFVINNRSKNRYQFAPVITAVSIQKIEIKYIPLSKPLGEMRPFVKIDDKLIFGIDGYDDGRMTELAINDGFDSKEDFFAWFNADFIGKIIHWTNLKY
ncbi:hypothetical protein ML462_13970 [Gramella lutea]|uniref:Uncharacterized protein n=1 Tax=Christiangramia lutea TaxID=1607951 RepID=A0A9X2ACN9_9FLAO|nr:hypothetical protein [Christiangramia lutea]MCH4824278.1 hypothetical protein [Christiangramia lutea]